MIRNATRKNFPKPSTTLFSEWRSFWSQLCTTTIIHPSTQPPLHPSTYPHKHRPAAVFRLTSCRRRRRFAARFHVQRRSKYHHLQFRQSRIRRFCLFRFVPLLPTANLPNCIHHFVLPIRLLYHSEIPEGKPKVYKWLGFFSFKWFETDIQDDDLDSNQTQLD